MSSFLKMIHENMTLQSYFLNTTIWTMRAHKGFFPSVCPIMIHKISFVIKIFSTNVAFPNLLAKFCSKNDCITFCFNATLMISLFLTLAGGGMIQPIAPYLQQTMNLQFLLCLCLTH